MFSPLGDIGKLLIAVVASPIGFFRWLIFRKRSCHDYIFEECGINVVLLIVGGGIVAWFTNNDI